jgi:hypothetical protein
MKNTDPPLLPSWRDHPAFAPTAMTGYSLEMWQISENLINWDTLFAFGFTSYQMLVDHKKKYKDRPLDVVREILMRLYMVDRQFPWLFVPPPINELSNYLFKLDEDDPVEDRKRCISLLALILGKNRGSGYRWNRNREHSGNPVSLPIHRLSAKVFSMEEEYGRFAREYFWRAALATARARGINVAAVKARLQISGVRIG